MKEKSLTRRLFAEALGSFGIVFLGCGTLMTAERFPNSVPNGVGAIAFGLTVFLMINLTRQVAASHLNPALSIAMTIFGRSPWRTSILCCASQFFGATLATMLLFVLMPEGHGYGGTIPTTSHAVAVVWEAIFTFFVICAVVFDAENKGVLAAITVALVAWIGGPLTGASMNPARSFGPSLAESRLDEFWIYMAGPLIGAICAVALHEFLTGTALAEAKSPEELLT